MKSMDLYVEMSRECPFCGSHNTFAVDTKKGVISCLDCHTSVSREGEYVSLIYITSDPAESRCVMNTLELVGSVSGEIILGFHVTTLKGRNIGAEALSGILKKDCVDLKKLNITFNGIRYSPTIEIPDSKLMEFGVISIANIEDGIELQIVGNSMDGMDVLKLMGLLFMSGVKQIRFV